jgi:hypothetical protein
MNTKQKLPSDALTRPSRRLPWILGGVVALAIAASAVAFGPALASQLNPTAVPTPTLTPYVSTLTPAELDSVQQGADQQHAKIVADKAAADAAAAAQVAADAAAAKAAHRSSSDGGSGGLPSGAVDPLNSFGSPDTTLCASGTASDNSAGVAICD